MSSELGWCSLKVEKSPKLFECKDWRVNLPVSTLVTPIVICFLMMRLVKKNFMKSFRGVVSYKLFSKKNPYTKPPFQRRNGSIVDKSYQNFSKTQMIINLSKHLLSSSMAPSICESSYIDKMKPFIAPNPTPVITW